MTMKMEQEQVKKATSAAEAREGELSEARRSKEKMDGVVRGLKDELEKT